MSRHNSRSSNDAATSSVRSPYPSSLSRVLSDSRLFENSKRAPPRPKSYGQEDLDQAYQSILVMVEGDRSLQRYKPPDDQDRPLPNVWEGVDGLMKQTRDCFPMPEILKSLEPDVSGGLKGAVGDVTRISASCEERGTLKSRDTDKNKKGSLISKTEKKNEGRHVSLHPEHSLGNEDDDVDGTDIGDSFMVLDVCGDVDAIENVYMKEDDPTTAEKEMEDEVNESEDLMIAFMDVSCEQGLPTADVGGTEDVSTMIASEGKFTPSKTPAVKSTDNSKQKFNSKAAPSVKETSTLRVKPVPNKASAVASTMSGERCRSTHSDASAPKSTSGLKEKSLSRKEPAVSSTSVLRKKSTPSNAAAVTREKPRAADFFTEDLKLHDNVSPSLKPSSISPTLAALSPYLKRGFFDKNDRLEELSFCPWPYKEKARIVTADLKMVFGIHDQALNLLMERFKRVRNELESKAKRREVITEKDLFIYGEIGRLTVGLISEIELTRLTANPNNNNKMLNFPKSSPLSTQERKAFHDTFTKLRNNSRQLIDDHNAFLSGEDFGPKFCDFNTGCPVGDGSGVRSIDFSCLNHGGRFKSFRDGRLKIYNVSSLIINSLLDERSLLTDENRKLLSAKETLYCVGSMTGNYRKGKGVADFETLKKLKRNMGRPEFMEPSVEPPTKSAKNSLPASERNFHVDQGWVDVDEFTISSVNPNQRHLMSNTPVSKQGSNLCPSTHCYQETHLLPKESVPRWLDTNDPGFKTSTYQHYDRMVEHWKGDQKHVKKRLFFLTYLLAKDRAKGTGSETTRACAELCKLSNMIHNMNTQFEVEVAAMVKGAQVSLWPFSPAVEAELGPVAAKYLASKFNSLQMNLKKLHTMFTGLFCKNFEAIQAYNNSYEGQDNGQVSLPGKVNTLKKNPPKKGFYNKRGNWVRNRTKGVKRGHHQQVGFSQQVSSDFQGHQGIEYSHMEDKTGGEPYHDNGYQGYNDDMDYSQEQCDDSQSFQREENEYPRMDGSQAGYFMSSEGHSYEENPKKAWDESSNNQAYRNNPTGSHDISFCPSVPPPGFPHSNSEGMTQHAGSQLRRTVPGTSYGNTINQGWDLHPRNGSANYLQIRSAESSSNQQGQYNQMDLDNGTNITYSSSAESRRNYQANECHAQGNQNLFHLPGPSFERQSECIPSKTQATVVPAFRSPGSGSLIRYPPPNQRAVSSTDRGNGTSLSGTGLLGLSPAGDGPSKFSPPKASPRFSQPGTSSSVPGNAVGLPSTPNAFSRVDPVSGVDIGCKCGCAGTVLADFPSRPPPGLQVPPEAHYWVRLSLMARDLSRVLTTMGLVDKWFDKINRNQHKKASRTMIDVCATLPIVVAGLKHARKDQQEKGFSEDRPYTEQQLKSIGIDQLSHLPSNITTLEGEFRRVYNKFNTLFGQRKSIITRFHVHAENFKNIRDGAYSHLVNTPPPKYALQIKDKKANKVRTGSLKALGIFSTNEDSQEKIRYYQTMLRIQKQVSKVRGGVRELTKTLTKRGNSHIETQYDTLPCLAGMDKKLMEAKKTMIRNEVYREMYGRCVPRYIQSLLKVKIGGHKKTMDNHIRNYDFLLKMIGWTMKEFQQFVQKLSPSFQQKVSHLETLHEELNV